MENLTKLAGLTKDDGDDDDSNTYFYDLKSKKFNFKTTGSQTKNHCHRANAP